MAQSPNATAKRGGVASIALASTLLGDLGMKTSWILLPGPVVGIAGFLMLRRRSAAVSA